MHILIFFAFLAGIITILSPCILPVLPIILSSSVTGSKKHAWGVVLGFILSFTIFTLFLSTIVNLTGISPDFLRTFAMVVIATFGLVLVFPPLHKIFEHLTSKFASKASSAPREKSGLKSGLFVGVSLGLLWTPCVGPILASVLALALTGSVSGTAFLITFAYALGTALPMLAILYGGRKLMQKIPWLLKHLTHIQKLFGILMILTAIAIFFSYDRQFQNYVLEVFPNYGSGLTQIEELEIVQDQLGTNMAAKVGTAPELIPTGEWFNANPFQLQDLRGKVILIDFWTYTCINCIRTLPYIQSWHEKYSDDGLVIIGVHTPEFEFEKNPDNLRKAIDDFGLTYPIFQDNDYKTWRAYENRYWPAKYFIDHKGNIVDTHFGEGDYDESEEILQNMLKAAGFEIDYEITNETYSIESRTPETYLGYRRTEGFASPESVTKDEAKNYSFPEELSLNEYALSGTWTLESDNSLPQKDAELWLRFSSKNVHLVMNPTEDEAGLVEVFLDGESLGITTVDADKLYDLIQLEEPGEHELLLKFLDSNIETFAFTFG